MPLLKVVSFEDCGGSQGALLSRTAVKSGFVIAYTHSVNKGRVRDSYSVNGAELVLDRTEFVSYGAGIPEASETVGARFTREDGAYVISGLNRRLPQFLMAVGVIAEHSVTVSEKEIYLKECFRPQTRLRIRVRRVPLVYYWRSKKL